MNTVRMLTRNSALSNNTHSDLKNIITEMKNTFRGINSRIGDTEEYISDLEDRIMEITQLEQQKGHLNRENKLRDC